MNKTSAIILFITFVLAFNAAAPAQRQTSRFTHIDIEQGLSQNMIRAMFQDTKGFMWFATWDGLSRYDGYEFKVYKHIDGDTTSLRINKITCLMEDHFGRLWVGTFGGGLSLFNSENETFTNFIHNSNDSYSISSDQILSLYEDSKNRIWIGTRSVGVSLIDNNFDSTSELMKNIKFINFSNNTESANRITGNGVMCIIEDNSGTVWFGSNNGSISKLTNDQNSYNNYRFIRFHQQLKINTNNFLDFMVEDNIHHNLLWLADYYKGIVWFDTKSEKFLFENPYSNFDKNIPIHDIQSILIDTEGEYWFGTYGKGIYTYKPGSKSDTTENFRHFNIAQLDPYGIDAANITNLFEDRSGLIWIGTNTNGLYILNNNSKNFLNFHNNYFNKNSLINDNVLSVLEDKDGNIWIGTELGLDKYDITTKHFTHYKNGQGTHGLSSDIVYSLLQDKNGIIWIGTSKGLDKYNPEINSFIHYVHNPNDLNSISKGEIIKLFSDSNGSLWIGSWNGGLNKLIYSSNNKTVKFLHYRSDKNDPYSISDNRVMSIAESKDGQLWIGTSDGGLNKLISDYVINKDGSVSKPKFKNYQHNPKDKNSLSGNDVRTILIDKNGTLWLGTFGGGLNKFIPPKNDKDKVRFIHYTQKDGLANDVVRGILQDDSGYLWIGTANGLSKFDPVKNIFWNFNEADGLQTVKFEDAYFKSKKTGRFYYGGIGGVVSFLPSIIKTNLYKPEIVITSFNYYNKKSSSMIEEKGVSEKKKFVLSYDNNILNFEFSALNFISPNKNKYAYKLDGYNNSWIQLGNKREVTFTNLDPGTYTLFVRGSNNDGVWNNTGTSLEIIITPPWWRTNWAYGAYILLIITGIFLTDRIMRRRVISRERDKAYLREAKLIKMQAEELETVDGLVRVINRAENLENLFNSLLEQTMNFITKAEKAAVFLRDKRDELFRVAFTAGYIVEDLEKISFTEDELKKRYSENSEESEKGIYIIRNTDNLYGDQKLSNFSKAKSMLVMAVEIDRITEAFVVFDSFSSKDAFDHSAANLLNRFREHAVSAISKAQAIKTLQDKNEEIIRTQEQLLTQQKLASLGALTAGIAHEIKNPLNFVNNFSELSGELLDEIKTELNNNNKEEAIERIDDLEQNLKKINQHGKRADAIVKGMLLHSRGTSGEKTLTDINDLLDQYVNLAYHGMRAQHKEFNITIEKYYDESIEKLNIVPQDISRVFLNLINNACYATNEKKKKRSDGYVPVLKVSTINLQDKVEIHISDNGNGIPDKIKDKLFNPFFTTKPAGEGTGLGLSLSYDIIVKQHGGEIKFESLEGEGTEFIVTLPQ